MAHRQAYLSNFDLTFDIDAEKLLKLPNTTFFLYLLGNKGQSPSEFAGDAQTLSNIDAPDDFKLYEIWIRHVLFNEKISMLAGLYDLNSEFDVINTGGLFVNSSHGIGADFAQSGTNGPSIFPTTSLGLRLCYHENNFVFRTAVWDGVAGDPERPKGTHVRLAATDGVLVSNELGYHIDSPNAFEYPSLRFILGSWFYTQKASHLSEIGFERNWGVYTFVEKTLLTEAADPAQGLSFFMRMGMANKNVNQFSFYNGGGLVYVGPFASREKDRLGLAFACAHNSPVFRNLVPETKGNEFVSELTYQMPVNTFLTVQPDIQYIVNPGAVGNVKNALVPGFRFELAF